MAPKNTVRNRTAGKGARGRLTGDSGESSGAAVEADGTRTGKRRQRSLAAISGFVGDDPGGEFHKLLNDRVRLGILSSLAVSESLSFKELKALLSATDGNLSVHARKLEDAGYLRCRKRFEDRQPRTDYEITAAGRRALERYLKHMEALIRATSD